MNDLRIPIVCAAEASRVLHSEFVSPKDTVSYLAFRLVLKLVNISKGRKELPRPWLLFRNISLFLLMKMKNANWRACEFMHEVFNIIATLKITRPSLSKKRVPVYVRC